MWRLKFTRQFSKPMQTILMKTKLKDPTMKNKIPKQNSFFMKPKIPSLAAMICCLMFLATNVAWGQFTFGEPVGTINCQDGPNMVPNFSCQTCDDPFATVDIPIPPDALPVCSPLPLLSAVRGILVQRQNLYW